MPQREADKSARLRSAFEQLSSAAHSLNTSTDELSKIFTSFDDALKKLNLGTTAWVTFDEGSDERGFYSYPDQLGYAKIASKWGLAIRQLKCDEHDGETELLQEWLIAEAPRALRIRAIDGLPDLVESLVSEVQRTSQRINEKLGVARELLTVVKDLSGDAQQGGVKK